MARSASPRQDLSAEPRPLRRIRGRWLVTVAALAGILFLGVAVAAYQAPHYPIDVEIERSVQTLEGPATLPFEALNVIGFPPVVTVLYALIVLILFLTGLRWEALGAGITTVGAAGLNHFIKLFVARPRPSPELVHVAHHIKDSGFPAGHVLNLTAFVGFLAYLVWAGMAPSWRRTVLLSLLVSMILLMGPARVLAGEHWPSDVLGAYLIAIAWLCASIGIYQWIRHHPRAPTGAVRDPR